MRWFCLEKNWREFISNSKSLFLELISILRIRAENFNLATQRLLDKKLENLRSRLLSEEHPVDKVQDFINKIKSARNAEDLLKIIEDFFKELE